MALVMLKMVKLAYQWASLMGCCCFPTASTTCLVAVDGLTLLALLHIDLIIHKKKRVLKLINVYLQKVSEFLYEMLFEFSS